MELGKYWKNEAFEYWGVGLIFAIPAILLFFAQKYFNILSLWGTLMKISVLFLLGVGFPFFFLGIPYLFWKKTPREQENETEDEKEDSEKREARFTTIATIILTLLGLATAAVKLVYEIIHH